MDVRDSNDNFDMLQQRTLVEVVCDCHLMVASCNCITLRVVIPMETIKPIVARKTITIGFR
ncbi:hypothetical protein N431DRAFT_427135 [Stipitochalara longipes BDJ]|nr:hypothetical protein N431DRAFT_427135 [Stipitochalara longipes BDJ]